MYSEAKYGKFPLLIISECANQGIVYRVNEGDTIDINMRAMDRDPDIWHDADEFRSLRPVFPWFKF